jgi:hypothetical protein
MIEYQNFRSRLEEFQRKRNARISDQAQKLIYQVLYAIENDPHPSWNIRFTNPKNVTAYFEDNIEHYLEEILHSTVHGAWWGRRGKDTPVTFFDVVHWLSLRINSLCPFIKD